MTSLVLVKDFSFGNGVSIQGLTLNGVPVFAAFEVAESLGHENPHKAVERHCSNPLKLKYYEIYDKKNSWGVNKINGLSLATGITLIKEADLLALISKSQTVTQQFKKEVVTALGLLEKVAITESRKEIEFREKLKKALEGFGLSTLFQHTIGVYRADVCIPEKSIIVEYDESGHPDYCPIAEQKRTACVESKGYSIVRVTDSSSDEYNIGKVFKAIFDKLN